MILKKNKVEEVTLQNLKTYYKATVIKTVCYWLKKKKDMQINKTATPQLKVYYKTTVKKMVQYCERICIQINRTKDTARNRSTQL